MSQIYDDFTAMVQQIGSDKDKLHLFIHGDENTSIATEAGPLPSLAAMVKAIQDGAGTAPGEPAVAAHEAKADPHSQYAWRYAPQVIVTENTELGPEHDGHVVIVVAATPIRITTAVNIPEKWGAMVLLAGPERCRIDAGSNPLQADNFNVLETPGTGATLTHLADGINFDYWVAGGLSRHLEDLKLANGTPLLLANGDNLEIEGV